MPRPGGEADKLGNRYEGIWTADSLLDVFVGGATSVTVEPFGDDSLGIEFIKETAAGERQFHSVKRQTTGTNWSLYDLTSEGSTESLLGQLFAKLQTYSGSKVYFVSGTTANQLHEFTEQAQRLQEEGAFTTYLNEANWRRKEFEERVLPLCGGDAQLAFDRLKRTVVVGIVEHELMRRVEQRIRADMYRTDGAELDPQEVRLLLGEMIFSYFGRCVTKADITEFLGKHGYRDRELGRDRTILESIAARNAAYLRHVEAELIQGVPIERTEASEAFDVLVNSDRKRRVVIIGSAGMGKSCVVAQTLRQLVHLDIPVIALRLDVQAQALTSDALGKQLGFPVSPAVVLARIARERRCVLLVDQLDALSYASGRNQRLWTAFEELLTEVEAAPNMALLLSCRAFDAEHDSRLRRVLGDEKLTHRINLGLLETEIVRQTVVKATGRGDQLSGKQIELLRTPLHLSLYLQGEPQEYSPFASVQELFSRYWEHKRRLVSEQLGREPKWTEIVDRLTTWLSDHQTLSAPFDILDEWTEDAHAMASHCLLSLEEKSCRFFHETFFDYAFARRFVTSGGKLTNLLLKPGQEQHLFRRAQVRQVLAYRRGRDFQPYLSEVRDLLSHHEIRFHIKKLILDWFHHLDQPTVEEWELLRSFERDSRLEKFIRLVPHNNPSWFPILLETQTWTQWLDSKDETLLSHAVWLLSLPNVMKEFSDPIAKLGHPRLGGSESKRQPLLNLFSFGEVYHSRAMFDLFKLGLRSGWFDQWKSHGWHRLIAMAKERPDYACEFLLTFMERQMKQRTEGDDAMIVDSLTNEIPTEFINQLEKKAPDQLLSQILPGIISLIQSHTIHREDDEIDDHFSWHYELYARASLTGQVLKSLRRVLADLSVVDPDRLEKILAPYEGLRQKSVSMLLIGAWAANPPRFADRLAAYILEDKHRLTLGFSAWSGEGGDGRCAISRHALRALTPHCSATNFDNLERTILRFQSSDEEGNLQHRGYRKLLLLEALSRNRMSPRALHEFEMLLQKFPNMDFSPPQPMGVKTVTSPIPEQAMEHMNDEQWLGAMRKYTKNKIRTPDQWLKGGIHELASQLRIEAQANKPRFAALAVRMPSDISHEYFEAILNGLAGTYGDLSDDQKSKAVAPEPLATAEIVNVIQRVHELENHPSGRTICSAIGRLSDRELPDNVYAILAHYALHDPNPDKESWQTEAVGGTPYYGGDPEVAGLNSVRGGVANAVAGLLFADKNRWSKAESIVRALVKDRSLAVRASSVRCLIALLNRDQAEAVNLFVGLIDGADPILGTHSVDRFLHYAIYAHYEHVRSILHRMLDSTIESAKIHAACQIAIASFHNDQAKEDLERVLVGDEQMRMGAAKVFAHNLGNESIRAKCRQHLMKLFNDDSGKVRDETKACFRVLSDDQLREEELLIQSFIESRAFEAGLDQLTFALEKSTALLPEVTCSISERLVALHLSETPNESIEARRMVLYVPELVLRLYEQTTDNAIKTRCLNAIDSMLELGFGSLESELQKIER